VKWEEAMTKMREGLSVTRDGLDGALHLEDTGNGLILTITGPDGDARPYHTGNGDDWKRHAWRLA
jgi:hypothetical protein